MHLYIGDELADLVDCKIHVGLVMREVPCRKFWAGFENMEGVCVDVGVTRITGLWQDWNCKDQAVTKHGPLHLSRILTNSCTLEGVAAARNI